MQKVSARHATFPAKIFIKCFRYLKHRDDLIRDAASAAAAARGEDSDAAAAAADPAALQWAHIAHEIQVPLQLDVSPALACFSKHILELICKSHSYIIDAHYNNDCYQVPEQAAPVFYMLRARLSEIDIGTTP